MVRIQKEQNLETLRQIGILLDNENKRLIHKVQNLTRELAKARGYDAEQAAQLELSILKELEKSREQVFRCDERRGKEKSKKKKGQKGHGPRPQPQLPKTDRLFELEDKEKECGVCGGQLEEMKGQFEESEEVTVVKRTFLVERQKRQKYRCRCNANVVTAPGPPKLISGGRYSVEFGVEVAVSKYADHLPLERQVRMMGREGLQVDTQTLWDQIDALAKHLWPTYEALGERVLSSPVVNADESRWPILGSKKKSPGSVWVVRTPEVAFYRMMPSKSTDAGRQVLGDYQGTVVADGYAVYENLKRDGPFRLGNCWSHVKRHTDDIQENFPVACEELLKFIRQLYDVERLVPGPFPGDEEAQQLRLCLRQERSRPIVEQIRQWAFSQRALPRSELAKLVRYILDRWEGLTLFLKDPLVPPDNNAAERALRGPVLGRKNHYGSRSRRGTQVAAIFYSLCETAKLQHIDPRVYLLRAALAAVKKPGKITFPDELVN